MPSINQPPTLTLLSVLVEPVRHGLQLLRELLLRARQGVDHELDARHGQALMFRLSPPDWGALGPLCKAGQLG